MSNREKISWCAGILLLVMLYLLSSTDLIIKEKKREICRISVIIDNVNDNYYGSFRAGMDMAEKKYQADVNFITLYAENDEEQQEELIVREIKDGANAIILAPVREDLAVMKLDEISPGCPVIFLVPRRSTARWRAPSLWTAMRWDGRLGRRLRRARIRLCRYACSPREWRTRGTLTRMTGSALCWTPPVLPYV